MDRVSGIGLGLVESLYRAHRAVVPVKAWYLVCCDILKVVKTTKLNISRVNF